MPITDEVRKYRETVLEQGKVALGDARKPWYAAVGAGDFAYERARRVELTIRDGRVRRYELQFTG